MTTMQKHATASVFLFTRDRGWRIGLIHHPRFHRWMLPGGHVEPYENSAEAALREVREETGCMAELINTHTDDLTRAVSGPQTPSWMAEQEVLGEARHPHPHIHVDHLYVAIAAVQASTSYGELRFRRFSASDLSELNMFHDSRRNAIMLFDCIDTLVANHYESPPQVSYRWDQ